MDDTITTTPLSGTEPVQPSTPASDGKVAGSEAEVVEVKELMKSILGKDFPDNDTALKSIKDTYAYVGQMGQKVKTLETQLEEAKKNEVSPDLANTVKDLQKQLADASFYASNPSYNNPEAKALITKFGGNPEEVVKDEVFQKAFSALKTTADMEQSKSVLHSNPRLGTAQDSMTKAVEAQKAGDSVTAAQNATLAVIEAYGMK